MEGIGAIGSVIPNVPAAAPASRPAAAASAPVAVASEAVQAGVQTQLNAEIIAVQGAIMSMLLEVLALVGTTMYSQGSPAPVGQSVNSVA